MEANAPQAFHQHKRIIQPTSQKSIVENTASFNLKFDFEVQPIRFSLFTIFHQIECCKILSIAKYPERGLLRLALLPYLGLAHKYLLAALFEPHG